MIKIIDTHCHLQFPQYDEDRKAVIERTREAGIGVINVGTDFTESRRAIELAEKYPEFMWATVGLHPLDARTDADENTRGLARTIDELRQLAKHQKVVAIGECGLDYYRAPRELWDRQKEIFRKHIELALEVKKPLVLHLRNAYEDALGILKDYVLRTTNYELKGTSHFFSGTVEQAKKFLELGLYISFAGPITFAKEYEEVVRAVPLERILSETDAPFAAPLPYRGVRNEPAYVVEVIKKIAELKGLSFDQVARATTKNAERLFNLQS